MSLERLWAGWRSAYVSGVGTTGGDGASPQPADLPGEEGDAPACVFCRIVAAGGPSSGTGVLWMGRTTLVVLNAYPYASGHLMALPLRHVGVLGDLTDEESAELWHGLRLGVAALEAAYRPEGINLGANLGQAAGAGIPRHLHLHAVPRWMGDTNFIDRKSTRLNSSHVSESRMPSSA